MSFLITGGASGLGQAITIAIARKYANKQVYFTYNSSVENAEKIMAEYKNTTAIKCNFYNVDEINVLCKFISDNELSVLINNALTQLTKQYFHKTTTTNFTESFAADVVATLEITKAFLVKARERKQGKIITMLTSALVGTPAIGWSTYLANKAYLLAMHKSWVAENANFNITSNCISPDFMATPLHSQLDERVVENMIAKHPLKKLLTVEEVADTVLFLCEASNHLNGQNIVLNAGVSL